MLAPVSLLWRSRLISATICTVITCGASPSLALGPPQQARMVAAARELVGLPYELGGRLRGPRGGIDCQGVIFYAAERIRRCGWRSYSVFPTRAVASGELGAPVTGLNPISSPALETKRLEPGDIVFLVDFMENTAEPAIGSLSGRPVWVWHTGLYIGDGLWINADPFEGSVIEGSLTSYLVKHADTYAGVFITRMERGPRPPRCRSFRPMRRPAPPARRALPTSMPADGTTPPS